ncbi:hypothetical protein [Croceicoccus naphthovorans]|uniref:Uncharacterized protein n=1 Tax=Croceicoccus naphthovorans TaxID=1348774 RepID=A0A0G3XE57_9SPHN|nr:hypothetical protein [Croceicoccus naphthovorans]AKM09482.1 hypothetical protein AB433_04990 [Croceicoccus naphthovorans]MBB3991508.1 hypothetical protein [Croceicoccus naphthovorans]
MTLRLLTAAAAMALAPITAQAHEDPDAVPKTTDVLVEIYRIAPGKHREFLETIAKYDEVNARAGLPPRQLYVHRDGASWDFMLIQPAKTPEGKGPALDAAWEEMGLPSGPDFFFSFRSMIAEHSDTFATGPISAADYLAKAAN